jgi:hypothetical protein
VIMDIDATGPKEDSEPDDDGDNIAWVKKLKWKYNSH